MLKNFVIVLINRWKVIFSDKSFSSSTFLNTDIRKLLSPEKEVRIFLLHWEGVANIKDPWFQNCWVFFSSQPWVLFNHNLFFWESNKYIHYIFGDMNHFVLRWTLSFPWPFHSQDLFSNSPYCLPYHSYDVSLENLVLDHLITLQLIFSFVHITYNICLMLCWYFERRIPVLVTHARWRVK